MTDKMQELFVRNQIMLDPTYLGEDIIVQGKKINTRPIARGMQEGNRFKKPNEVLELYMVAIRGCEELSLNIRDKRIPMSEFLSSFKTSLPERKNLDPLIDAFMPHIAKSLENHWVLGDDYIIDDNLLLREFSVDVCNLAMQHLFGAKPTRFVYANVGPTLNGNILDLKQNNLEKFYGLKQEFSSYCNLVRAFGYPYTDYRHFVSKGYLVSVDLSGLAYLIHEDTLYCVRHTSLNDVLLNGMSAMPPCTKVYSTKDLELNTKASLGGIN